MAYSPRTFSFLQHQRQLQVNQQKMDQQQKQPNQPNQVKIKLYFNFNHFYFNNDLCNLITKQFFNKIEKIINSVYLKLILKDIDDTRKWNNYLELTDNLSDMTSDSLLDNSNVQTNFECDCVWSVSFKLHRLHQSLQKLQYTESLDSAIKHRAEGSHGLKKLRECLCNFKIDDTPRNDDIYVYKRNNEIYLLTLREIYSNESQEPLASKNDVMNSTGNNEAGAATPNAANADESLLSLSHSMDDYEAMQSLNINEAVQSRQSSNIAISRRQSNATVEDFKVKPSNVAVLQQVPQVQPPSLRPDSIKLCLYGLNEPDDEFKQELCKMLQMELDNSLLVKICGSIERNSYKTASLQHPDRLIDEDIQFLKQISDSYIDLELPMPFIFNLNKTLRDHFFYYVRHIFNINFKSMDVNSSQTKTQSVPKTSLGQSDNASPLNPMISPIHDHLTAAAHTHQHAFSFITTHQTLGSPLIDQLICNNELQYLCRVFFHNKFPIFGKNTSISLVLVECLYAPKGLEFFYFHAKKQNKESWVKCGRNRSYSC
jgi:hypothetical protein